MKVCSACQKNYADPELNFCLECGATLSQSPDDSPPTVMVKSPRETNPNWQEQQTLQYQSFDNQKASQDPFQQGGNMGWTPPPAPLQGWQNQRLGANTPFQPPMVGMRGRDQNLPIAALILGISSLFFVCCYGFNLPFGIAALITGYMGMNNAKNNPSRYEGHGLALAGLIMGGIGTLAALGWIILIIIAALSGK